MSQDIFSSAGVFVTCQHVQPASQLLPHFVQSSQKVMHQLSSLGFHMRYVEVWNLSQQCLCDHISTSDEQPVSMMTAQQSNLSWLVSSCVVVSSLMTAEAWGCVQFVLSVEVSRLGTYAMLPNAFLTPRSLVPYNEVSRY